MKVLDLFSGIGGFSLGLERAGMETVAFCEIDPFCRKVLAKHWPDVPIHEDITKLRAEHVGPVDLVCGGFPCQDISNAGQRAGIEGERSGLWSEMARLIGEIRPRYAVVENVSALLSNGMGRVLGDLAALGYDAEWHCIPASAVGAPHRRDRVWIIAHVNNQRQLQQEGRKQNQRGRLGNSGQDVADTAGDRLQESPQPRPHNSEAASRGPVNGSGSREAMANANGTGLQSGGQTGVSARSGETDWRMALAESQRCGGAWWAVEPELGRVAYGVSNRVDRIRSLGNAVVPQVVELIGRVIMEREANDA